MRALAVLLLVLTAACGIKGDPLPVTREAAAISR